MISSRLRFAAASLSAAALVGAGLANALPAAASPATASPATASTSTVRTVTHSSSGKTLGLKKGHELAVDLRTVYTAGYEWFWTQRPAKGVVKVVSKRLKPYPHKSGEVGYPYHTIFLLKAVGSGTTTIKLVERRSFDKTDVAAHFTLTIHVPAAKSSSAQHACTRTSSGSCIQGGEFCPQADYGSSGWDASGRRYVCTGDHTHPHWETP